MDRGYCRGRCRIIGLFVRSRNPYSMYGYYFLTQLDTAPLSPESVASSTLSPSLAVTTFHDRVLHEVEAVSPGRMGRNFYGENFLYTTVRNFSFDIPGITTTPVTAQMRFLAKSTSASSSVSMQINGGETKSATIAPILDSDGQTYKCGVEASGLRRGHLCVTPKMPMLVKISFSGNGATAAYLDYILLNMERELRFYDGQVAFRHRSAATRRLRYDIDVSGAVSPQVWDVTVPYAPQSIDAELSGGKIVVCFPPQASLREHVAFDAAATFLSPIVVGPVSATQNLHALSRADLVIVSPPLFMDEAKRLGEFHVEHDSLSYLVVQPAHIYNEFSSGTPDATAIRRFMKMFYDRARNGDRIVAPALSVVSATEVTTTVG